MVIEGNDDDFRPLTLVVANSRLQQMMGDDQSIKVGLGCDFRTWFDSSWVQVKCAKKRTIPTQHDYMKQKRERVEENAFFLKKIKSLKNNNLNTS